ncbi:MAG: ADOP family duplicated permease [Vicinamibacterales bacterium]
MWKRLARLVRGGDLDRQLHAEMHFHLDMEAEKYMRQGMDPDTARRQALRNFGPMTRHVEETRDARGLRWIADFLQDARYAARTLAASPGYAAVAVLTLGLGIGANAAIFSVVNGVVLTPLPYANGQRLLLVNHTAPLASQQNFGVSIKELYDYREQLASFDGLVEFHQMNFDLLRRGEPDRVATGVVSHNFFDVLGIQPILGRTFSDADDDEGAEAVLVLGHDYWTTRFAADPGIIGQVFQMNDRPHTVIGVLPDVPHYPNRVDLYMPTSACPFRSAAERTIAANRRAFSGLRVFGLVKDGVAFEAASTEVATVGLRFQQDFPDVYRAETGFQARTAPVLAALTAAARPVLWLLLATTGLVLLLACANVANLTLARMLRRDREFAMRAALGAGRGRLIRQLLSESTLLAAVAGVVGLAFAWTTLGLLTRFVSRFTQRTDAIGLDPGVLLFTLSVAVASGIAFGLVPALSTRSDVLPSLKQGSLGSGVSAGRRRLQDALVVAQVALSVVMLVGASLLLASVWRLQRVEPGYRADRVLAATVFGNFSKYPDALSQLRLYEPLVDRLNQLPGVEAAAITNAVPLVGANPNETPFDIEGRTPDPDRRPRGDVRVASPRYFETLGIPVVSGRAFTALDHKDAQRVVVINQAMARYWEGGDPIGARLSTDDRETWWTVVGVVGDVRQFGLDRAAVPQAFVPLAQMPGGLGGRIMVRSAGDPTGLARSVIEAVHALDPDMPVEDVQTLEQVRSDSLARPRLTALLLAIFAALAMAVTLAGVTGVIAANVSQRTREFGVRMALGATRGSVLLMVLGQGLGLVALGLVLGLAGAAAFSTGLSAYLFDTPPRDPLVLAAVAVTFLVAGALACVGPARRATGVDPLVALRAE